MYNNTQQYIFIIKKIHAFVINIEQLSSKGLKYPYIIRIQKRYLKQKKFTVITVNYVSVL